MLQLLPSPSRPSVHEVFASARHDVIIACPFIKLSEAEWACRVLHHQNPRMPRIKVLTHVRADAVLGGSLDIDALELLARAGPGSSVVNLPRLHAKVYLADDDIAVVGSANLTPAGLDFNYEYGVVIRDRSVVTRVRGDLEAYARIGNTLMPEALAELSTTGRELVREYEELERSVKASLRRRFNRKLQAANYEFLRAQVGDRSANGLFSEAIVYILSRGPLATRDLHPRIQRLLPDLCDDSVELVINGERFGKRWKHAVRNSQQALKRAGIIEFANGRWSLAGIRTQ